MMMLVSDVIVWMKTQYPSNAFYNGMIPKNTEQCIGVYLKNRGTRIIAIGGYDNTSYASLPLSLLIHWGKDADACQQLANKMYELMQSAIGVVMGNHRVIDFDLQDNGPVNVDRDENGICEMVIRMNIIYERQVMT
jgi:hypothetical protein